MYHGEGNYVYLNVMENLLRNSAANKNWKECLTHQQAVLTLCETWTASELVERRGLNQHRGPSCWKSWGSSACLAWRGWSGDLTNTCKYLQVRRQKNGYRLFSVVLINRIRGNRHKPKYGKLQPNMRKNLFTL